MINESRSDQIDKKHFKTSNDESYELEIQSKHQKLS